MLQLASGLLGTMQKLSLSMQSLLLLKQTQSTRLWFLVTRLVLLSPLLQLLICDITKSGLLKW
jgi:hypothetical protein